MQKVAQNSFDVAPLSNIEYQVTFALLQVCFTLSQATKALRESRGISLLYFDVEYSYGFVGWGVCMQSR